MSAKLKKFFESVDPAALSNKDVQGKLAELVESAITEIKTEKDLEIAKLQEQLKLQESDFKQTENLVCEQFDSIVKKLEEKKAYEISKLDEQYVQELKTFAEQVDVKHSQLLEDAIAKSQKYYENILSTKEEETKKLLEKLDEDACEKLTQLIEETKNHYESLMTEEDEEKTNKLQSMVEKLDEVYTNKAKEMIEQIKAHYETKLTEQDEMACSKLQTYSESVDEYVTKTTKDLLEKLDDSVTEKTKQLIECVTEKLNEDLELEKAMCERYIQELKNRGCDINLEAVKQEVTAQLEKKRAEAKAKLLIDKKPGTAETVPPEGTTVEGQTTETPPIKESAPVVPPTEEPTVKVESSEEATKTATVPATVQPVEGSKYEAWLYDQLEESMNQTGVDTYARPFIENYMKLNCKECDQALFEKTFNEALVAYEKVEQEQIDKLMQN